MEEKQHGPIGPVICAAFGFIASAITIVGWFGVTPDMVGAKAASLFGVAAPFLEALFGFLTGWSLRGIREHKRGLAAKAEGEAEEKAKHDAIAREFASLNLMQAMSMNIIAAQPNGMLTKRGSDRHRAFAERPDVAVITESSENADAVRIALTSEWNGLMNTNRHIFDEVWAEKIKEFNVQKSGAARS